MAKLKHYEEENRCYFVTSTTHDRRRIFTDRANCEITCNLLFNLRARGKLLLAGFVLMPDHIHLLIMPQGQASVSEIMRGLKKSSARLINMRSNESGKLWMDEYHEMACRSDEQMLAALNYTHNNPVAAGLVRSPEDFPFSSANPRFETDLGSVLGGGPSGSRTTPTAGESCARAPV